MENDRVDVKWKQWNKWSACSRAEETPGVIFLITRSCWNAFPFILKVLFFIPPGTQLLYDCSAFITPDHRRRSDWWVWMWVFGVIGIKLPAPQKLSCGPFWSDGFWLGSPAPGLQMWFEDCFYLPLWNTRTDKKQTILSGGGDTKGPS